MVWPSKFSSQNLLQLFSIFLFYVFHVFFKSFLFIGLIDVDSIIDELLQLLIKNYNAGAPEQYHLKMKGSANVELPGTLVQSFFRPLFENIKNKVFF